MSIIVTSLENSPRGGWDSVAIEGNRHYFPAGSLAKPEKRTDYGDFLPSDRWTVVTAAFTHVFVPGFGRTVRIRIPKGTKVRLARPGTPRFAVLVEVIFPEIEED